MRGADITQAAMFSYRTLEERIPREHPLRKFRRVVDGLLSTMDRELDALYARTGRASIPPERLLRASLIQILFSIRSERQLVQHIDYNLLYRWFVGLDLDDGVWDHSAPSTSSGQASAPIGIGCSTKGPPGRFSPGYWPWRNGKGWCPTSTSRWTGL